MSGYDFEGCSWLELLKRDYVTARLRGEAEGLLELRRREIEWVARLNQRASRTSK